MSGTADQTGSSLTFDLRGIIWGIEAEVAHISRLSRRIDERVREVNVVRAEAAQRMLRLDELVDQADDPYLRAWLEDVTSAVLPQVTELFPDRLYTD